MIYFFIFLISFLTVFSFAIVRYYEKLIINYSFEDFYTGNLDNKIFIAKDLFSSNYKLLVSRSYNFSEGIYINKLDSTYFVLSNTNFFSNRFSLLVTYFNTYLSILENKLFYSYGNYYLISVNDFYEDGNKIFFLCGLIDNVFDFDVIISKFNGVYILDSIRLGTNLLDYPIYFYKYNDNNFDGYLILSLIENNYFKNFDEIKFIMDSNKFNSNSILVCFLDSKMNVIKYFAIRFPRNIIDYEIIRKSIDSVLIKIDFIDRVSGYYIVSNYINISYSKTYITGVNTDVFNQFYIDDFVNFKNSKVKFYLNEVSLDFTKALR